MTDASRQPLYTVSQLNRLARTLLEQELPALWVSGEISNLARPASGHLYFTLKDDRAQIRCALFRGRNRLNVVPANGQQVLVRGRISLYEPRGDYQLIAEHLEPAGEGLLRQRLEELKRKLAAEGLFDVARKRPLPALPRQVGVVTSPSGAAVRDILHVLARRFPAVPVVIYPTPVQGDAAKGAIARALALAGERAECDVLIVARGGGSLEDLWAFNEEVVARAIAASPIPVVSGVGHETDFTLADLAADVRAPTPSGAAELAVPDADEWRRRLVRLDQAMAVALRRTQLQAAQTLDQLRRRLDRCHPGTVLARRAELLRDLVRRLAATLHGRMAFQRLRLANLDSRLAGASPVIRLRMQQQLLIQARLRLASAIQVQLERPRRRLAVLAATLQVVSPLKTLERGYAIVQDAGTGQVLRDASALKAGDRVVARLARGSFTATVEDTVGAASAANTGPVRG